MKSPRQIREDRENRALCKLCVPGELRFMEPMKTLRDEFAMVALQGLLADQTALDGVGPTALDGVEVVLARSAYRYADAMLAARGAQ